MKHIALYFGMTALLLASCSIQEKDFQTPIQDDVVFYASFEQPGEDGTKVYATENLLLRWTADDRVSIFNKNTYNQQYQFIGETGDYEGGFNKVGDPEFITGDAIPHIVSVYPYQRLTRVSEDEVVTVSLPSEQSYALDSFGLGANTMVSVSSGNLLKYRNVGGYLMFKLYGESVSVSSITLRGNNGEILAGDATVTMPLDGVPTATMAENATSEITLNCPAPVALGATAEKSTQFWFVVPPVTFSKGFTITVTHSTGGVFEKSTSKSIAIERNKLTKMSPMEVEIGANLPVPEAVDLGLPSGIKWASFNLGASKPEEYGDYYAWGETEPYYSSMDPLTWKEGKEYGYSWESYMWCEGDYNTVTKYCRNSSYGFNGFTDFKTILELEDDAAYVNFGSGWRMPTDAEWMELRENCTWTWTRRNGVNGCMFIASNGNSIFIPAAGYLRTIYLNLVDSGGYYWSSSLNTGLPYLAWDVRFNFVEVYGDASFRYDGRPVRPVYGAPRISVTGVSLDKTSLSIDIDDTLTLTATVTPSDATVKSVIWVSSNPSVASVSPSGVVTGISAGTATITVTTTDGGRTATCTVTVTEPYTVATPEAVDMGLSVKWASFNLGATKPEEYGDYYAWGETEPYYSSLDPITWKEGKESGYSWASYQWSMGDQWTMTKYCSKSEYGYNGFIDSKISLDPEDDAAHVNLSRKWRTPTDSEWAELRSNCTWTWTTQSGVNGRLVTASNGNSIFFPAAGYRDETELNLVGYRGVYWSSDIRTSIPCVAWTVRFDSLYLLESYDGRNLGFSIRPVYAE